ncbi:small RNA 2'-O-methyltransferase isoform X1 [Vigna unguiculata]|uniref:small RNA 2'-O-methyltransferase isoform X1 n=2 Tax=Vigna unguiculata TaxID=3917 RepID=UPI00101602BF|nr:small RNA 2'-O-methyltransferase isoform X1 [Vigna unguiculata]XP_027920806.1 small RNA 2'-O-methyltransferase isoform X1 [Vigna unguiculata]XP_027920807.1 small RNA 2'-O-methyltransferase isoform X1 [Vigna unguiculata]XP_027920808.1 small RNA 2'-O-methyltransferase isoform X1 [Vigna unguiculata]
METREHLVVSHKKPTLTPKAIIHQNFGNKASYVVEEVKEVHQIECPGLSIPQMGPCLYRCTLQLPELSVISGTFKKKKDAEQSAAEIAIEKLGICSETIDPTPQEAQESLVARIAFIFSEKFLLCDHPLGGHIRATLWRKGDLCRSIPISVLAMYDPKLLSLCKCINPDVESNPFLVISHIKSATANLYQYLATSERHLCIRRLTPYPQDIVESLMKEHSSLECIQVAAIRIPSSVEQSIEQVTLRISLREYYLDVIANELGLEDAANVMISRNLGKASSETRLFFTAPKPYLLDLSSKFANGKETLYLMGSLNVRASYFAGQDIAGDAILASIGYTRKSRDIFYEDVSVRLYYRMLLGKTPGGIYKLSREAILASELPSRFTTRANWRGSLPRDILCMFCRQHRLSEPLFSFHPFKTSSLLSGSCLKVAECGDNVIEHINGVCVTSSTHSDSELFKCEIKLLSRCGDLILLCSPKDGYKKQNDAIQNTSLKVLSWLNMWFKSMILSFERLCETADDFNIQIYSSNIISEILAGQSTHNGQLNAIQCNKLVEPTYMDSSYDMLGDLVQSLKIEGPFSGVCPCNGSLPCIRYSVSLAVQSQNVKEVIEVCDEFEFEVGVGATVSYIEEVVMQMSVGQYAYFSTNFLSSDLVFASSGESVKMLSLLSSKDCCIEYDISLIKVTEPPEERMEQALFSPPLSKQRVEFGVQQILESHASTLIDFGCGSGSLLEALLNYPTSLEKMAGVDISQKGLSRAAKVLNSKLCTNSDAGRQWTGVQSVILYEGSITNFGSQLQGFDIGTCLEVIEHMEEDQACLFGDVALSFFRPRILIVSTPNFEYNVVLQKSNPPAQEQEELDDKTLLQSCKFRNHDHKFEWTRAQFRQWASDLAARHNYKVEFSGVGGSAEVEPGYASQIAVFKRDWEVKDVVKHAEEHHYNIIWEWNSRKE